jgi:hypothetical protein
MNESRTGWDGTSQVQFQQIIKGYEKRVESLASKQYPPSAFKNGARGRDNLLPYIISLETALDRPVFWSIQDSRHSEQRWYVLEQGLVA